MGMYARDCCLESPSPQPIYLQQQQKRCLQQPSVFVIRGGVGWITSRYSSLSLACLYALDPVTTCHPDTWRTTDQWVQCDQIGLFLVLGGKFPYKSCPNSWQSFWVILKDITLSKNCWRVVLFGPLLEIVRLHLFLHLVTLSVTNHKNTLQSQVTTLESFWLENCCYCFST